MSLINDALKRAKDLHGRQPPLLHADPPLQPVLAPVRTRPKVHWVLPAVGGLTLLFGIWFIILGWRQSHASVRSAASSPPKKVELSASVAKSSVSTPVTPPQPVAPLSVKTPAPSAVVTSTAAVALAVPAKAPTPPSIGSLHTNLVESPLPPVGPDVLASTYRLQGIFYRISKASALINGQTLFVNDEIEGAKLLAIERQSVRLLVNGRSVVLRLR